MERSMEVGEFLQARTGRVVLDVRSPGEYAHGHVPGALSFPLFSDEERAEVGTAYKQQGREAAFGLGLELVGPKMAGFVREAARLAPQRRVAVHCWRGGQRSRSMGWLLDSAGFDVALLEGGYKNYRHHVLESFETPFSDLRIVGGRTGTGKTRVLHALRERGEQVIDLEGLACHKGSSFGAIGEAPQPTVEQFENDLAEALSRLDPARPIWVENESRSIGRVYVPEAFWSQMRTATLYQLEIPLKGRLQNLVDGYARVDKAELEAAFRRIDRKLGGQNLKLALEALDREDYHAAAAIALQYYDKTYQHGLENNCFRKIHRLNTAESDPAAIAQECLGV
jgi:tRNA 2-selenouridine synthase